MRTVRQSPFGSLVDPDEGPQCARLRKRNVLVHTPSAFRVVKYFLCLGPRSLALPPEAKHHECPITWPLGWLGKVGHEDAGGGATYAAGDES